MLNTLRLAGIWLFLHGVFVIPAMAKEEALNQEGSLARTYFKPYPADGAPIEASRCGHNVGGKFWTNRDLGQGANIEVGVTEEGGGISVTLLIRYHEGKVELYPDEFLLHVSPGEKRYKPSEVRRKAYQREGDRCAPYGEWVYLKFPVRAQQVEQAAVVFPNESVSKGRNIIVRPFRFEKVDDSAQGGQRARAPINIAPDSYGYGVSAEERMKSCDPNIALAAAMEVIGKPATLREPLSLFMPAFVLFQQGKRDEAVFWFYAAQLRTRYQLVFEKGDRGQLLMVMMMTTGPLINNYAFQDVTNLSRILDRVLEWDGKTPNPYRDRPRTESIDRQIEQVYSGFRDLKTKIISEKDTLEKNAKLAAPQMQAMSAEAAKRCVKPGQQGASANTPIAGPW